MCLIISNPEGSLPMASRPIAALLDGNGFKPGFTAIPNELLDWIIPVLFEAEVRVLLYVCRRTFGFGKACDRISLLQICLGIVARSGRSLDYGTNLSKPAVIRAVKSLVERGVLLESKPDRHGRGATKTYSVVLTGWARRRVDEKVKPRDPSDHDPKGQSGRSEPVTPVDPSASGRVSPMNTQEKAGSGKSSFTGDESGSPIHSSHSQSPGDGRLLYDDGPEFDQRESTWQNPDPDSDDFSD
jgi:hypothetical protein